MQFVKLDKTVKLSWVKSRMSNIGSFCKRQCDITQIGKTPKAGYFMDGNLQEFLDLLVLKDKVNLQAEISVGTFFIGSQQ